MASVADAIATMEKNIAEQTGKSVTQWVALARKTGFAKHGEILKWLKTEHGIGHGYANHLAKVSLKDDDNDEADLVAAQYAGKKGALMPLYLALVKAATALGPDVEIAPKKNNVSIRRNKQFALFQPSTADRIDVGLILKGVEPEGRLEASGSFNAMFTHRVRISTEKDIDRQFKAWLKEAYGAA